MNTLIDIDVIILCRAVAIDIANGSTDHYLPQLSQDRHNICKNASATAHDDADDAVGDDDDVDNVGDHDDIDARMLTMLMIMVSMMLKNSKNSL